MDKVLVFAETEKDLLYNKDLDNGPRSKAPDEVDAVQMQCRVWSCEETGALMGPGSAVLR